MEIKRDSYLEQVKSYAWDGQVKVITGIRRCGKSYLLRTLYRNYLLKQGVSPDNIITIELDIARNIRYRNPLELAAYVRGIVENSNHRYYLFVDEIQMSDEVPKTNRFPSPATPSPRSSSGMIFGRGGMMRTGY